MWERPQVYTTRKREGKRRTKRVEVGGDNLSMFPFSQGWKFQE